MNSRDLTNVEAAVEMLLEEIESEIELVNTAGSRAFIEGNYERVDAAREQAGRLTAYREKVAGLRKEWLDLMKVFDVEADADDVIKQSRRDLGRLDRGIRTPENVFYLPILHVLVELGGSGQTSDVLDQLEKKMMRILKNADFEKLPSEPNTPRWRNTARWARYQMVNEGLLRDDSPRGLWEISNVGRDYLRSVKNKILK